MKIVLTFNGWGGFGKITFSDDSINNKKEAIKKYENFSLKINKIDIGTPILISAYKL